MNEFETKVHQHDITLARLGTLIEQNDRRFDTVEDKIDNSEKNTIAQFESSEKNTAARFESSEKNTTARFDSLEQNTAARFESSEKNTAARFDAIERKIDSLDRRMNWFLGLLFTSWLSTIGVILYKLQ